MSLIKVFRFPSKRIKSFAIYDQCLPVCRQSVYIWVETKQIFEIIIEKKEKYFPVSRIVIRYPHIFYYSNCIFSPPSTFTCMQCKCDASFVILNISSFLKYFSWSGKNVSNRLRSFYVHGSFRSCLLKNDIFSSP